MAITYLKGDATWPKGDGPKILAHVCNDVGGWGSGFVVAVSKRWRQPELAYRAWERDKSHPDAYGKSKTFGLGNVQLVHVQVEPDLWVANMVAQRGYGPRGTGRHRKDTDPPTRPPIRYDALALCLLRVGYMAGRHRASVHMPRIGCGLAGGKWDRVEPLIEEMLQGRDVYVYDL